MLKEQIASESRIKKTDLAFHPELKPKIEERKKELKIKAFEVLKSIPSLEGTSTAAFTEASREQFIEFALERKYLQRNTKT